MRIYSISLLKESNITLETRMEPLFTTHGQQPHRRATSGGQALDDTRQRRGTGEAAYSNSSTKAAVPRAKAKCHHEHSCKLCRSPQRDDVVPSPADALPVAPLVLSPPKRGPGRPRKIPVEA